MENIECVYCFILRDFFEHKREKATVYLNFDNDKNINIELEQDKLKEYVNYHLPIHSGWFLSSSREYKLKRKRRYRRFENIVEFILRKDYTIVV